MVSGAARLTIRHNVAAGTRPAREQLASAGNQTGGRGLFFLATDDSSGATTTRWSLRVSVLSGEPKQSTHGRRFEDLAGTSGIRPAI